MSAKKKPDAEAWAKGRLLWEADPSMSQLDVAKLLGVTKQAVQLRAKNEGWKKVQKSEELARRAYQRADEETIREEASKAVAAGVPAFTATPGQRSEDAAVNVRARVISRHRKEWDGVRNHLYEALRTRDFETAKLAKITSEALKIIQDGERKAHGLDQEDKSVVQNNQTTIVIERREGAN